MKTFNTSKPARRTLLISLATVLAAGSLFGEIVYSSIPKPLPGNVASLGYEATSTSEFGNGVNLAPIEKTIALGKQIIDYRAEIAVKEIRKAIGETK